jgi:hypothetical protein
MSEAGIIRPTIEQRFVPVSVVEERPRSGYSSLGKRDPALFLDSRAGDEAPRSAIPQMNLAPQPDRKTQNGPAREAVRLTQKTLSNQAIATPELLRPATAKTPTQPNTSKNLIPGSGVPTGVPVNVTLPDPTGRRGSFD